MKLAFVFSAFTVESLLTRRNCSNATVCVVSNISTNTLFKFWDKTTISWVVFYFISFIFLCTNVLIPCKKHVSCH